MRAVRAPFDGRVVAETCQASAAQLERATVAAVAAFAVSRRLSGFVRGRLLAAMAAGSRGDGPI